MFSGKYIDYLREYDLVVLDIGARGGVCSDLAALGRAVHMIGFEPEPVEAERLSRINDEQWRSITILPYAIGGHCGNATLYVPPSSVGASLLEPNSELLEQFGSDAFHTIQRAVQVRITTLDALRQQGLYSHADYLKLDVEGAELDVLQGAKELLETVSMLKVEVSFVSQRLRQPLIWKVVEYLREMEFEVIDMFDVHRWRRRPVPAHPYRCKYIMPYSRGRIISCDLMLTKRLNALANERMQVAQVAIAGALGYYDHSISVMRHCKKRAQPWVLQHGERIEAELQKASQTACRGVGWRDIKSHLRGVVPRLHSMITGIPFANINRPY